jgi:hypothetical protein
MNSRKLASSPDADLQSGQVLGPSAFARARIAAGGKPCDARLGIRSGWIPTLLVLKARKGGHDARRGIAAGSVSGSRAQKGHVASADVEGDSATTATIATNGHDGNEGPRTPAFAASGLSCYHPLVQMTR